jgi:hypothetical protein
VSKAIYNEGFNAGVAECVAALKSHYDHDAIRHIQELISNKGDGGKP